MEHQPDPGSGRASMDSEGNVLVTFSCTCGDFYCYYMANVATLRHIPAEG